MKIVRIIGIVAVLLIAVLIVATPLGPLPGFFIGGAAANPPAQWPDTSDTHEIRLKVPGTLPRVVIIWVVEHAGELHVVGAKDSGWVQMLGDGGPVELRLADNTYALNATPVTGAWQPVLEAWLDKYRPDYPEIVEGFPAIDEAEGTVAVYRLDRA